MITNKLLILLTIQVSICLIQISVAQQKDKIILNSVSAEKNNNVNSVNDSGITWSLHEPLKNCIQCHGDQLEQNSTSKPHLVNSVPDLCYSCHKDLTVKGEWLHGPVATGECLVCHEPHKADNRSLLKKPIPELCYKCHETSTLRLVANHTDKSYTSCNDCHDNHSSLSRMLLKQNYYKAEAGRAYINKNPSALSRFVLPDRRSSLVGLEGVKVVIILDGSKVFKRYGITEDFVRTKVELQLKKNGINILNIEEQNISQPSLQIQLRLMEVPSQRKPGQVDALSGSFNLFLKQIVELLPVSDNGNRRFCTATTWNTDAIMIWGTSQIEEGLTEAVEVLVSQFCKDYIYANLSRK
jgi:predicted CXXCH cytochrome family protein